MTSQTCNIGITIQNHLSTVFSPVKGRNKIIVFNYHNIPRTKQTCSNYSKYNYIKNSSGHFRKHGNAGIHEEIYKGISS